jgi:CheY-like chemotaxis protein
VKVLVVGGDADTVELLALCLVSCTDWDVRAVTSGVGAVEICRSGAVDAVLLEVETPVLDDLGVLAALRADPATEGLPVVFVTALADPVLTARLSKLGATAVLAKPFDVLRIGEQVARCLGWPLLPPGPVDVRAGGG